MQAISKHALPPTREQEFELIACEVQVVGNQGDQVSKLVRLRVLDSYEKWPHQGLEVGNGHPGEYRR